MFIDTLVLLQMPKVLINLYFRRGFWLSLKPQCTWILNWPFMLLF